MEELRKFTGDSPASPGGCPRGNGGRGGPMKAAALGILAKAIFFLPALAVLFIVFFVGIFYRVPPTAGYPHWLN